MHGKDGLLLGRGTWPRLPFGASSAVVGDWTRLVRCSQWAGRVRLPFGGVFSSGVKGL